MKRIITIIILIISTFAAYSQSVPVYPESQKGYKRVDLILPELEGEKGYKIEVRFGMIIALSECEEASFSFTLNNVKTRYGISPSRFPYYVLESNKADIDTEKKSGCDSTTKVNKKILSSQNITIEYQSSYPRPFYIPESWTIEYRIWAASDYITIEN